MVGTEGWGQAGGYRDGQGDAGRQGGESLRDVGDIWGVIEEGIRGGHMVGGSAGCQGCPHPPRCCPPVPWCPPVWWVLTAHPALSPAATWVLRDPGGSGDPTGDLVIPRRVCSDPAQLWPCPLGGI